MFCGNQFLAIGSIMIYRKDREVSMKDPLNTRKKRNRISRWKYPPLPFPLKSVPMVQNKII